MNFQELRDLQYKEWDEWVKVHVIPNGFEQGEFTEPKLENEFNGLKAYRGGGLADCYFFLFQNDELICCFHARGGFEEIYSPEEYLEEE